MSTWATAPTPPDQLSVQDPEAAAVACFKEDPDSKVALEGVTMDTACEMVSSSLTEDILGQGPDAVLDARFKEDPFGKAACETATGHTVGEVANVGLTEENHGQWSHATECQREVGEAETGVGLGLQFCTARRAERFPVQENRVPDLNFDWLAPALEPCRDGGDA